MRLPFAFAVALAAALAAAGALGMQAAAQQAPRQTEQAEPSPQTSPQLSPDNSSGPRERRGRRDQAQMSDEDRTAFLAARLAAVRAGLLLSPEQDRLWPAVEDAVRNMVGVARDRRARMRESEPPADRIARMRRMGEFAKARGEAMIRLADAAEPLFATLSDDQKRRLRILVRRSGLEGLGGRVMGGARHMMDRHPGRHFGGRPGHRHDGMDGYMSGRKNRDMNRDMNEQMDRRMQRRDGRYRRGDEDRQGRDDDGQDRLRHGTDWTGKGFDRGAYLEDWRTL